MLLREPEGNSVQSQNGNVPVQRTANRRAWIDVVENINSNETNSISVGCREGQTRPSLDKIQLFDSSDGDLAETNLENLDEQNRLNLNRQTLTLELEKSRSSPICADFSPDEGLFEYEDDHSYSSSNESLNDDDEKFDKSASISDDSCSNDKIIYHIPRGIHNPNYPGFQHLAYTLQEYIIESPHYYDTVEDSAISDFEDKCTEKLDSIKQFCDSNYSENELNNNNVLESKDTTNSEETQITKCLEEKLNAENNNTIEDKENLSPDFSDDLISLKREIYENFQKPIADTLENIGEVVNTVIRQIVVEHDVTCDIWNVSSGDFRLKRLVETSLQRLKIEEKLANVMEEPQSTENNNKNNISQIVEISQSLDKSKNIIEKIKTNMNDAYISNVAEEILQNENNLQMQIESNDKRHSFDINFNQTEVEQKMESNNKEVLDEGITTTLSKEEIVQKCKSKQALDKTSSKKKRNDKKASSTEGGFDVYNIETAMPNIDLDAIENHLRAAREEERRRRNDREEIRRRLAMGTEHEDFYSTGERPGRKPSLQSRLQSGMNLQICFMNETASDNESPDLEVNNMSSSKKISSKSHKHSVEKIMSEKKSESHSKSIKKTDKGLTRPSSLALNAPHCLPRIEFSSKIDFFECQARLQTEARMALAQAKEIAHMQMEAERQSQDKSPITEMLRHSLEKAGIKLMGDRRRVSRQMLTDINVAQLQIIVNELHTQIEKLNENLVELLIARDELHMGQDSMLVDIEDLTRHLGAKDQSTKIPDVDKQPNEKSQLGDKHNNQARVLSTDK